MPGHCRAEEIVADRIQERIRSSGSRFFVTHDLQGCGTPESILMALSRMNSSGLALRVRPGLYFSTECGAKDEIRPDVDLDQLASAMGRQYHSNVYLGGSQEAIRLGLNWNRSNEFTYLTDGLFGRSEFRQRLVILRSGKTRLLDRISTPAGLVLQALYWCGPSTLEIGLIRTLQKRLPRSTLSGLLDLAPYAARWVQKEVKSIAQGCGSSQ